jgi:hypothetical protein
MLLIKFGQLDWPICVADAVEYLYPNDDPCLGRHDSRVDVASREVRIPRDAAVRAEEALLDGGADVVDDLRARTKRDEVDVLRQSAGDQMRAAKRRSPEENHLVTHPHG